MSSKICFIVTDIISFNVLYKGQLEYFRESSDLDITLICGGNAQEIDFLKSRNVGRVVKMPFVRKPSIIKDFYCLSRLSLFFLHNRFDLVVYCTPKALLLGSLAAFFTMQKVRVAIVFGRAYENFTGFKKLIFQYLDKIIFSISHDVLFISNSLLDVCKQEGLIGEKAKMVNEGSFSGVNTQLFEPIDLKGKSALRDRLGLPLDSYLVCVVGRICEDKGIKDIEYLAKNLGNKNIKFLFVGRFEDEIGKAIVEKIVNDKQGFYIPHTSTIYEIFQCSDLHLFLSRREGFGNVAIEAASCGLPTFAYDVVGVKDSVSNDVSGQKFALKDVFSMRQAIDEASTNTKFYKQYVSARDWVIENFEETKIWQSYLNFYLKKL
jgi:glycosyltransferase involved in cell wall biosynthesis